MKLGDVQNGGRNNVDVRVTELKKSRKSNKASHFPERGYPGGEFTLEYYIHSNIWCLFSCGIGDILAY